MQYCLINRQSDKFLINRTVMNETFSINRYSKLLKKELTERAPIIVKIAGIFSLLLVGYWLTILLFNGDPVSIYPRITYLRFATFLTMVIAPFNLYKDYNHPKKGIDYVILPASVTEKFLNMLTNTVIFMPLITFSSILLVDSVLSTITPSIFPGYVITSLWEVEKTFGGFIAFLIFQQGCIFGNFLFRKNKIFKTLLSGAGIYIALALIVVFLISVLFKEQFVAMQNTHSVIKITNLSQLGSITGSGTLTGFLKGLQYFSYILFYGIFPAGFLAGTFYKMKTQQY